MTLKKGIVVRISGSSGNAAVHKLDDQGEFNLGLEGSGHTVNLNGVVSVSGLASDVKTMLDDVASAISTETTNDQNTINDIDTKLTNLETQLGVSATGEPYPAASSIGATSFKGADNTIHTAVTGQVEARMTAIMDQNSATSFMKQIADKVFGDDAAAKIGNLGGTLLTIKDIKDSLTDDADDDDGIDPVQLKEDLLAFINTRKLAFINNADDALNTLGELSGAVAGEIGRYETKDSQMDTELGTTLGNSSLNADGTANFGYAAYNNDQGAPYISGATTLKAADILLDTAIAARETSLTNLTIHLDLAGDIEVDGSADLNDVSFTPNSSRFSLPTMTASAAEDAAGVNLTDTSGGQHDGKFVLITTGGGTVFQQSNKLYMCEDGVWHPSAFIHEEQA